MDSFFFLQFLLPIEKDAISAYFIIEKHFLPVLTLISIYLAKALRKEVYSEKEKIMRREKMRLEKKVRKNQRAIDRGRPLDFFGLLGYDDLKRRLQNVRS